MIFNLSLMYNLTPKLFRLNSNWERRCVDAIFIDFVACVFYAVYVIHDCLLHMKIF